QAFQGDTIDKLRSGERRGYSKTWKQKFLKLPNKVTGWC
ncbi:MAG: hypothetical protein ACI91V_000433, partial [Lentimonas sp.]